MRKCAHLFLFVFMTLALSLGSAMPSMAEPAAPAAVSTDQGKAAPAVAAPAAEVKQDAKAAPAVKQDAKAAPAKKAAPKDNTKAYICLGILAAAAIFFCFEIVDLAVTAMLVPCALVLTGLLTGKQAFANFGESNVVLFMAMFILGDACFITGFADKVGKASVKLSKGSPTRLLVIAMIFVGVLSGFLSNTGTVAMAIPMLMGMCAAAKIAPNKILLPVAFAASLGGCLSMVGTPPNLLCNAALEQFLNVPGVRKFGFFEFAWMGVPLLIVGVLYFLTIGRAFLPKAKEVSAEDLAKADAEAAANPEINRQMRPEKMPICVLIFLCVVVCMAGNLMNLTTACMLGAMFMVITKCVSMKEAYNSIDWQTIFLFAGMLSMSTAMQKSGAAALLANTVVGMVSSPVALLAATSILAMLMTNFMSNTATAALLCPLAIPIALQAGVSPLPIAMGITVSCSACFLTPIATPPNTLVLGPGKYSFNDYWKAGGILQIICFAMIMVLVPMIWPF
ncbi:MAG: SLC13 family permease [Desulfovibrionaceae bacterium]|nr:SLC13 family permease [Desulfovibrionaceae bacterium]